MAVIKADLAIGGRQIKGTFNGYYINNVGQWNIAGAVQYIAYCDKADESPVLLLQSPKLPQIGNLYVEGGTVFRRIIYKDATPRYIGPEGRYFKWEITYTLEGVNSQETVNSSEENGETAEDSVLISFSITSEKETYNAAYDLDGKPNCNSLGEFYADPIAFNTAIVNFNFTRKEYRNPLWKIDAFFETHNMLPYWGFPPGRFKVAEITADAERRLSGTEWNVNYKLQYRRRGWTTEKANTGYYCLEDGYVVRATNDDGSPTDAPVILNADGTRWTSGTIPVQYFRTTYPADFARLRLPNPFKL